MALVSVIAPSCHLLLKHNLHIVLDTIGVKVW